MEANNRRASEAGILPFGGGFKNSFRKLRKKLIPMSLALRSRSSSWRFVFASFLGDRMEKQLSAVGYWLGLICAVLALLFRVLTVLNMADVLIWESPAARPLDT